MKIIHTLIQQAISETLIFDVLKSKNDKFGDYSSNILMKNKLNVHDLIQTLESHPLFLKVDVMNHHLNFWINPEPLIWEVNRDGCHHILDNRMKNIVERLTDEGYNGLGVLGDEWHPLSKMYNLMVCHIQTFGQLEDVLCHQLIDAFKAIDEGYIYREQRDVDLSGINHLLSCCVTLLEGK